jgi:hypothetical protein
MDTGRNKRPPGSAPNPAGRVIIDNRGRNVWQWNDDQLDSTSIVLKRLENSALALEPTRQLRKLAKAEAGERQDPKPGATQRRSTASKSTRDGTTNELRIEQTFKVKLGGGFDPYNRS